MGHQAAAAAGSCAHGTEPSPLGSLRCTAWAGRAAIPHAALCAPQATLSLCPHWVPALVSTTGWRAPAKAGITLPKLPVLQLRKGSQSCSSSGLCRVSPAFSGQVSAGFLGYPTEISWKRKGRPLEGEQGLYGGGGSCVRADAKIWHLRSQHHQKFLLTSPTQTLVSQGPSGSICPSSVMGLSPSGNSPREPGYFFFLFCFLFLDEAIRVFPMSW